MKSILEIWNKSPTKKKTNKKLADEFNDHCSDVNVLAEKIQELEKQNKDKDKIIESLRDELKRYSQ